MQRTRFSRMSGLQRAQMHYDFLMSPRAGMLGADIREHLPTLREYAAKVERVTEMGVRWICSTWALLLGNPKIMTSYDIEDIRMNDVYLAAKEAEIDFTFLRQDTRIAEIEETDLLFIDTLHQYKQLKRELEIHPEKVSTYLIFHDTESFGFSDEPLPNSHELPPEPIQGLRPAINDFMHSHPEWKIEAEFKNCNGLLILKRV